MGVLENLPPIHRNNGKTGTTLKEISGVDSIDFGNASWCQIRDFAYSRGSPGSMPFFYFSQRNH
jgi:hypothetical protein